MKYLHYLYITYQDGEHDYIGSDNFLFLCELGEDGLKSGRYLSASIQQWSETTLN